MSAVPELLLVDKPKGITSFDVIRQLRRRLDIKKMGHAGTLDPLATGLMLIGIGPGTKQLADLVGLDKEYTTEILLGEQRTTGDLEGEVIDEKAVTEAAAVLQCNTAAALTTMVGEITLPVSAYSAIKVDGVPMYKRARQAEQKGEPVTEVPWRTMRVIEAELQGVKVGGGRAVVTVRFVVGSGTYIRSLAEELGRRLSYPATIQNLRRTRIGTYHLTDAKPLAAFGE